MTMSHLQLNLVSLIFQNWDINFLLLLEIVPSPSTICQQRIMASGLAEFTILEENSGRRLTFKLEPRMILMSGFHQTSNHPGDQFDNRKFGV